VTSVVGGKLRLLDRTLQKNDHDWVTALFAKVEGMSPEVLSSGLPWDWESFPSFLDAAHRGTTESFSQSHGRPLDSTSGDMPFDLREQRGHPVVVVLLARCDRVAAVLPPTTDGGHAGGSTTTSRTARTRAADS